MKNQKLGFTLVELLIVIAIIGVLAGALLVGLDPIEQINRGRDAAKAANLREFINACERHYAVKGTAATACTDIGQELKNCDKVIADITPVWSEDCGASTFTNKSKHYKGICTDTTCTVAELAGL